MALLLERRRGLEREEMGDEDPINSPLLEQRARTVEVYSCGHISMETKLSAYHNTLKNGCGTLHRISRAAYKPGLSHCMVR